MLLEAICLNLMEILKLKLLKMDLNILIKFLNLKKGKNSEIINSMSKLLASYEKIFFENENPIL